MSVITSINFTPFKNADERILIIIFKENLLIFYLAFNRLVPDVNKRSYLINIYLSTYDVLLLPDFKGLIMEKHNLLDTYFGTSCS